MAGRAYTKEQQLGSTRKRYRRKAASAKTWEKLRDERLGPCLLCRYLGIKQASPSELHHCVPRDRFGDDAADNLVSLCRTHHRHVEDRVGHMSVLLAEAIQRDEPAVYAYAVEKLGEDGWLRLHSVRFGCVIDESAGLADA